MRLVVVRHGVTDWNAQGRLQGRTDTDLSAEGLRQAHLTARRLRDLPLTRVLCSPMRRATRTALPIAEAHGLPLESLEALQEAHMGLWEGLTWEEVRARYPAHLPDRERIGPGYKGHLGESVLEVAGRTRELLERLRSEAADGTVCVVTHASPGRHLIAHATGDPSHLRLRLRNASVSVLSMEDGRARVDCLDDVSHLEEG